MAAVCSASTRVVMPCSSTSGRKLAARAAVDVGATSQVDRGSESDCTTTAYRAPDRSWPRVLRFGRRLNTSPRTQRLHVAKDLGGLGAVRRIGRQGLRLRRQSLSGAVAGSVDQCRTHHSRHRVPVCGECVKRPLGILVGAEGDGPGHVRNVTQDVRRLVASARASTPTTGTTGC